jgi:surfeit locus 1 family protein
MPAALHIRFAFWPALGAAAGIALTVTLGFWQLGRAAEKHDLQARFEQLAREPALQVPGAEVPARDVELRHVEARGTFEPRYAVFVDNRIVRGIAGYHVVMPLRIANSDRYVLVNRGWVAGTGDRARLPEVRTPAEPVTVSGTAIVPGKRFLELSKQVAEGRVWQNLTIERYRQAMPIAVQPFVLRQESPVDDGLTRVWDPPDFGIEKHQGYAVQWFLMAMTILIFYLATHVSRRNKT